MALFCVKTFIYIPYQKNCVMNRLSLYRKNIESKNVGVFFTQILNQFMKRKLLIGKTETIWF